MFLRRHSDTERSDFGLSWVKNKKVRGTGPLKMHDLKMQDLKMTDQIAQQNRWVPTFHSKGGATTFLYTVNIILIFVTLYVRVTVRVRFCLDLGSVLGLEEGKSQIPLR